MTVVPRKKLIRSAAHPYHVTARGNNREIFPLEIEQIWKIFEEKLRFIEITYQVRIHAFVLMPNHFHLLLTTPNEDLGVVMKQFMQSVTQTINTKSVRSGRIFGASYHWSMIHSLDYFDYVLKYIYRNPVKAGLSLNVENYHFSTLKFLFGTQQATKTFKLFSPDGTHFSFPNDSKYSYLEWLNEPFKTEQDEGIKKALRRTTFKPSIKSALHSILHH